MTTSGSLPILRIAADGRDMTSAVQDTRHFIGLHLCRQTDTLHGALVRTWGRGLLSVTDVLASTCCHNRRIGSILSEPLDGTRLGRSEYRRPAAEMAELAAEVVAPLIQRLGPDTTTLRAIGLLNFGNWNRDPLGELDYVSRCDTAQLAKLTGLTVIDDLPSRDIAHGGRGGPCEAVGAWLLLSDRGIVPGRVIRALVDLDQASRLFVLPPRQSIQLPPQLTCYELGPALSLLDAVVAQLTQVESKFNPQEKLAVQARRVPALMRHWQQVAASTATSWTPNGPDIAPFLQSLAENDLLRSASLGDVLCSTIHLIADQVATCVTHQLPRSVPIGQLVLGGPLSHHAFLIRQISQLMPEIEVVSMQHKVASTESWRSVAAALLAMLHVDQVPGNSPALTGTESPRILGRITPGAPGNWHRVLADMAATLPDKMPLRSAI